MWGAKCWAEEETVGILLDGLACWCEVETLGNPFNKVKCWPELESMAISLEGVKSRLPVVEKLVYCRTGRGNGQTLILKKKIHLIIESYLLTKTLL